MAEKNEYDWVDDPFKDESSIQKGMSKSSKAFVGCGCLVAVVIMIVLIIGLFESFVSLIQG